VVLSLVPATPTDDRFAFGRNWASFQTTIDARRIADAERSLQTLLSADDLVGKRFLDAGSGSGLFSLAAHRLHASVTSFDLDPDSVACTCQLKARFTADGPPWQVLQGSLTDSQFLASLGQFDIVYCWGVAHHTGQMWQALDNLSAMVAPGGTIVLAIYNDQQYISRAWRGVKRLYQRLPRFLRPLLVAAIGLSMFLTRLATTLIASLLRLVTLRNPVVPFLNWIRQSQSRGMHAWYDLVDWVGGWPFEVARPEDVFRFMRDRGFTLHDLNTTSGHGCNEFVFFRK
jgi:2-polyprenyl-3-methyl-5-hydroxy-6-metoxy-1,4-benzoquinol methylase